MMTKACMMLSAGLLFYGISAAQTTNQTIVSTVNEALRINATNGYVSGFNTEGTARNGFVQFQNGLMVLASETGNKYITINPAGGNVGIGMAAPAYKLDVNGELHAARVQFAYNDFLNWGNQVGTGRFRWSHEGTNQVNLKVQYSSNSGTTWNDGYTLTSAGAFLVGSNEVWHKGNLVPVVTGANPTTDFNTINPGTNMAGIYRFDPAVVNNPYGYAANEARSTSVFQQGNATRGMQIVGGDYNQPNRLFFRGGGDAGWRQWNEVWHSGNFTPGNFLPLTGGTITGKLIVGSDNSQQDLNVNGIIKTRRLKVTVTEWPDYVFEPSYKLTPLPQLAQYIQQNKHLPEIPAADTVTKEGVDVGVNQTLLLKKIEELTLYIIQQNSEIQDMKKEIKELKATR